MKIDVTSNKSSIIHKKEIFLDGNKIDSIYPLTSLKLGAHEVQIVIINQGKKFRTTIIVRDIYSEVLNILQAVVMNKLNKKRLKIEEKKYLDDAMMTSIAGISAAMKNTG